MTPTVEHLVRQIDQLSESERIELVEYLADRTGGEGENADEVRAAWRDEIRRRVEAVKMGQATGRPVEEVLADLRARYL